MTTNIHPAAIISPGARIAADCFIGPFSVIEQDVVLGEGCFVDSHVVIKAGTVLGQRNQIASGAVIGGIAQHKQHFDQSGSLVIGNDNVFREFVTVHRALKPGQQTVIGDRNLLMVNAHVAHDCRVGSDVIIANNAMIAGHVHLADRCYISGAVGIHQFCRIGTLAMVGGQSHVTQDVPPYVTMDGLTSRIVGLNSVGMRRAGLGPQERTQIKQVYRIVYRSGLTVSEATDHLRQLGDNSFAQDFASFLANSQRGCVRGDRKPNGVSIEPASTLAADSNPAIIPLDEHRRAA